MKIKLTFPTNKLSKKNRRKALAVVLAIVLLLTSFQIWNYFQPKSAEAAWWDGGAATSVWGKRKQLTLTNESSENLAADITVAVTVDTSDLVSSGKLQSDCDDLRVVHDDGSQTELTRHLVFESGTTCTTSKATKVHFPLQATFNTATSTTDYYMYYDNGSASSPSSTDNAFDIGSKDALLVCPFNGSTTCAAAETPSAETGAIRYGGAKTAMEFSGRDVSDDYVNLGSAASLDNVFDGGGTIEMWVYLHSDGYGTVVGQLINKTSYRISTAESGPYLFFTHAFDTDNGRWNTPDGSFIFNTWNHIAVYYDSSSDQNDPVIYINGVSQSLNEVSTPSGTRDSDSASSMCIGGNCGANSPLDGIVDEVRISRVKRYDSNFTPPTAPFVRDEYTVGLYHFDEGGDDPRNTGITYDDSGEGNDGTLTGNPVYVEGLVGKDSESGSTITGVGKTSGSTSFAGHEGITTEETATNKFTNPSFEHTTYDTSWTASASATLTEETGAEFLKFGDSAAKMVISGADSSLLASINVGNTNNHTLSAYVFNGTSGVEGETVDGTIAQLHHDAVEVTTTYTDMGGGWWRLSATNAGVASSVTYGVEVKDTMTVYIDGMQLEELDYKTSFIDGSLTSDAGGADTYFWDDDCDGTLDAGEDETADQNTQCSTRIIATIEYASSNIQKDQGAVSLWVKPLLDSTELTDNQDQPDPFYARNGGGTCKGFMIRYDTFGDSFQLQKGIDCSTFYQASVADTFTAGEWIHLVGTWDTTSGLELYVNAGTPGTNSNTDEPASISNIIFSANATQGDHWVFSDLRIFDTPLTSTEIDDLYQAGLVASAQGVEVDAFGGESEDPIAIYHFDESYGTQANDSSRYGNHLTMYGPTWDTGSVGSRSQLERFMSFDGTDDQASSSAELAGFDFGTSGFSVSGWFRHSSTAADTDTIISKYGDAGFKVYMDSSGYVCAAIDDDTTWSPDDSACSDATQGSYADSRWHHFEAVKDGTTSLTLYVDGQKIKSDDAIAATGSLSDSVSIFVGADTDNSNYWDGDLDELIIYPYARTADQVKADVLGGQRAAVFGESTEDFLTNGLVGYWKMEEGSSDTSLLDSSGNGNDGPISLWGGGNTATASARLAGKFGKGIDFDGTDDVVDITAAASINDVNPLTICAWINVDTVPGSDPRIFDKADASGGGGSRFGIDNSTNTIDFANTFENPTTFTGAWHSSTTITLNTWQHACMTYDESSADNTPIFYLDGQDAGLVVQTDPSGTVRTAKSDNSLNAHIGNNVSDTRDFDGTIDDVRVYNRIFSPAEIRQLADWAPGPVGYWPLDENTGTSTVYDRSGNGYDGTMTNFTESSWVHGKHGSALQFDESDTSDVVVTHTSALNPANVTFSAWFKVNFIPTNNTKGIISKKDGTSSNVSYTLNAIRDISGNYETNCLMSTDGTNDYTTTSIAINTDTWYHVSCTYDGDTLKMYLDGVFQDENTSPTGDIYSGTSDLKIGRLFSGTIHLDAVIDEVIVYNYARTPQQIVEDMNAGHPAPGSPVGSALLHYKFDEGYGDTANDSGTGGNNGDLGAGTTCPQSSDSACPTWTNSGKFGKALDFDTSDTTDDIVSVNNPSTYYNLTQGTISAWVNVNDLSDTRPIFSASLNSSDTEKARLAIDSSGNLNWGINQADTWIVRGESVQVLSINQWYHVAVAVDGSGNKLFINGERAEVSYNDGSASSDFFFDDVTTPNVVDIGFNDYLTAANDDYFDGQLDEVKIFNSALTADQIKQLFNQGKAVVFGAKSSDTSGTGTYADTSSYCPPGSTDSCTGPIGEWKLDENTGGTAYDTTGTGNDLTTLTDITWVPGKVGRALEYNGTTSCSRRPTVSSDLVITGDITVSAWVYRDTEDTDDSIYRVDGDGSGETSNETAHMYLNDTDSIFRLEWQYGPSSTNEIVSSSVAPTITSGSWVHLVAARDTAATEVTFYENGAQLGTVQTYTNNSTGGTATPNLNLGAQNCSGSTPFDGKIDHVRTFNYERTPAQIAWEYNRGGPIGWWRLDEGTGQNVNDAMGNGNDGFLGDNSGSETDDPTWTTGKYTNALAFLKTDQDKAAATGNTIFDFGASQDFSFSVWVKSTQGSGDWNTVFHKDDNGGASRTGYGMYMTRNAATEWMWQIYDNGTSYEIIGNEVNDGSWHHLVGIREGSIINAYEDGVLLESKTASSATLTNTTTFRLGTGFGGSPGYEGDIDELRVFNYALTAEQVKDVYAKGAVRFE